MTRIGDACANVCVVRRRMGEHERDIMSVITGRSDACMEEKKSPTSRTLPPPRTSTVSSSKAYVNVLYDIDGRATPGTKPRALAPSVAVQRSSRVSRRCPRCTRRRQTESSSPRRVERLTRTRTRVTVLVPLPSAIIYGSSSRPPVSSIGRGTYTDDDEDEEEKIVPINQRRECETLSIDLSQGGVRAEPRECESG